MRFGDCRRDHLTAGTANLRILQNVAAVLAERSVLEQNDEANADDCQAHEEVGPAAVAFRLSVVLGHADAFPGVADLKCRLDRRSIIGVCLVLSLLRIAAHIVCPLRGELV